MLMLTLMGASAIERYKRGGRRRGFKVAGLMPSMRRALGYWPSVGKPLRLTRSKIEDSRGHIAKTFLTATSPVDGRVQRRVGSQLCCVSMPSVGEGVEESRAPPNDHDLFSCRVKLEQNAGKNCLAFETLD